MKEVRWGCIQTDAVTTEPKAAVNLSVAALVQNLHFKRDKVVPLTGRVHFHVGPPPAQLIYFCVMPAWNKHACQRTKTQRRNVSHNCLEVLFFCEGSFPVAQILECTTWGLNYITVKVNWLSRVNKEQLFIWGRKWRKHNRKCNQSSSAQEIENILHTDHPLFFPSSSWTLKTKCHGSGWYLQCAAAERSDQECRILTGCGATVQPTRPTTSRSSSSSSPSPPASL